jgi:putative transposase
VAGSIRSHRVIEVLAQLISTHRAPRYLRSDNGPEFVSQALLEWMQQENIETALIDPGKPWQNGADESFNGKLRNECLSLEWIRPRTEARDVIEKSRRHYNAVRAAQQPELLDPACLQAAALTFTQTSRPPGMNSSNGPRQVSRGDGSTLLQHHRLVDESDAVIRKSR